MGTAEASDKIEQQIKKRAESLYQEQATRVAATADRMFAYLMPAQWLLGVIFAVIVSPRAWEGLDSAVHMHVWTALVLGGAISAMPMYLGLKHAGAVYTRHVIACCQMLMSALLIHLTGGRIETHFHVFGSLAFIAFGYRDWRVIVPATVTIAVDHLARGIFWPQSVFGVMTASPWRTLEHASWVIFEDIILVYACVTSTSEMRLLADRQARIEDSNENIEYRVLMRTAELRESEERFRGLVSASPVAMLHVDKEGRCLYANDAYLALSGMARDQMVGRVWTSTLHPEDRPAAGKLENGGGPGKELRVAGPKGDVRVRARKGDCAEGESAGAAVITMEKVA